MKRAFTLTNGRYKFRGSTVSKTLGAPCEGQRHCEAAKKDGREGMKRKEGGRQRGWRGRRWRKRVVESHYAAQWLRPDYSRRRPRGHCPPPGRNPLAEWKISVEHPGNDTGTLRRTHADMHARSVTCFKTYHLLVRVQSEMSYIMV